MGKREMVAKAVDAKAERRAQIGQEKRARTRAAILDATFQVIGHENGRLARIEQVTEVARIARPTFYTYFSSMEELFAALSYELSHEFNTAVTTYCRTLNDYADESASAVRYYLHKAAADHKWGWSMVNLSLAGPIFGADTFEAATASVAGGIESGVFKITDVRLGRDLVLGTTLAAMKTVLTGTRLKGYPEMVARQILLGLGVSGARAERMATRALPELVLAPAQ